jgi:glycosyltransferase involved in cell wall biosynthesis
LRVLVDALSAPGHPRGIGRYVRELVGRIGGVRGVAPILVYGRWHRDFYLPLRDQGVELVEFDGPPGTPARHLWHLVELPRLATRLRAHLVHLAQVTPVGWTGRLPIVATIHDVAEYDWPQTYGPVQLRYRRAVLRNLLRRATRILAPSRYTAGRLAEIAPSARRRLAAVENGPGLDPGTKPIRPAGLVAEPFFLFVGAMQRHKNVPGLIRAFRSMSDTPMGGPFGLVLAGPDHNDRPAVEAAIAGDRGIVRLPQTTDAELAWLYHHATALVFASLSEGFGFPIIEAMGFGCPVIAADRGAAREAAGAASLLVDPSNEAAMRSAMERLATGSELRQELAAKGRDRAATFSWDRTAEMTIAIYREVVDASRPLGRLSR